MIASNRKLSRLPLVIFEGLLTRPSVEKEDPATLKSTICSRLKKFPVLSKHGGGRRSSSTSGSIKTVGQLLQFPKFALMVALDPLLTYEEVHIFICRVCQHCVPKPMVATELLQKTMDEQSTCQKINAIQQQLSYPSSSSMQENVSADSSNNPLDFGDRLRYMPTGLSLLDQHLLGGIRLGTVTEVVGEAGVGKTQFGLQLIIMAARYNQGAIYIDTENKLPVPRLRQMGQEWRKRALTSSYLSNEQQSQFGTPGVVFSYNLPGTYPSQRGLSASQMSQSGSYHVPKDGIGAFKPAEQLLDNLTVHNANSTKDLLSRLSSLEDEILHRNQIASEGGKYPVRLLIVDSIAAPMRRDYGADSAPQRSAAIFQCAQKLKRLADQLHLAVVVINQVGSADLGGGAASSGVRSTKDLLLSSRAALGTSWHHCVSTRLVLETSNENSSGHSPQQETHLSGPPAGPPRRLSITKSTTVGYAEVPYDISNVGIVDS